MSENIPTNRWNLLTEAAFTSTGANALPLTLPGLLAAMTRGEVQGLARLRPHQRPAWHMFLVQLSALALWTGGRQDAPEDEESWAALLCGLTADHEDDAPWCLFVADRTKPAFLQPPDLGGLKWTPVPTPDALDMLITSRNHDLKTCVAKVSHPEDWVFALVSLQTMEGYGGKGNCGISRMNGGSSSRPMLGLAPTANDAHAIDESRWWQRDVKRLLASRAAGQENTPCSVGGTGLVWILDWPVSTPLDPASLDPWFIEVCRLVRMKPDDNGFMAERSITSASRIAAKEFKGVLFEPWGPVHKTKNKLLTISGRDYFSYKCLQELLFSGDWDVPLLAQHHEDDPQDMILVAEAISRGNSKTDGFRSRLVSVPRVVVRQAFGASAKDISSEQIADIDDASKTLRQSLAIMACGGRDAGPSKDNYKAARPALTAFDRKVDALFFPNLWAQVEAAAESQDARATVRGRFTDQLKDTARKCFEEALPAVPCVTIYRPRAKARARRYFERKLHAINPVFKAKEGASDDAV